VEHCRKLAELRKSEVNLKDCMLEMGGRQLFKIDAISMRYFAIVGPLLRQTSTIAVRETSFQITAVIRYNSVGLWKLLEIHVVGTARLPVPLCKLLTVTKKRRHWQSLATVVLVSAAD